MSLKFLIIIPAHNEQENIFYTLKSLQMQTFQNFYCVVVNDGSTDKTEEITNNFIGEYSLENQFKLLSTGQSGHQPGAKVVRTFNAGLETVDLTGFNIICKFDADIIFPPDYLNEVAQVFSQNPKAGMVSGLVRIKKSVLNFAKAFDFNDEKNQWKFEAISSKDHVRGPIKSYRKECFLEMKGLRPVLGWDNIDVMLAKKNGWEIVTLKHLWVKHLRPTADHYRNQKAIKLGEYFYNIGLNWPLTITSSAKSAFKNRSLKEFFVTLNSFSKQKGKRALSKDEIKFVRNLRWKQMLRLK